MQQTKIAIPHFRATNPDRVSDKCRECHFFLVSMAEYERQMDIEKLLYCLSAFLSAFRTAIYRSFGVVRAMYSNDASKRFLEALYRNADIKFLKEKTDLEVHGDGATVWQNYRVSLVHPAPSRWRSEKNDGWRSPLDRDRFQSHAASSLEGGFKREAAGWQFDGHPKNLIELCHDSLEAFEEEFRKGLKPAR